MALHKASATSGNRCEASCRLLNDDDEQIAGDCDGKSGHGRDESLCDGRNDDDDETP